MTPMEFITFWRAQPFRAFRVHLRHTSNAPTRSVDITQPLQLAMSPNLQTATLALDDSTVSFRVEEIERCDWLDAAHAAAAPVCPQPSTAYAPPSFEPGTPAFLTFSTTDGHRVVAVSIDNRDGRSCFTTAGTRFDIHGLESFENGSSLYLHHLDHPSLEQRVIIWPASSGTFESFSEAMAFGALYTELKSRDAALIANPVDVAPADRYFDEIVPRQRIEPPRNWWEKQDPDPEDRFSITLAVEEVGPHHWASLPRVVDSLTETVLFDLWETRWDLCAIESAAPARRADPGPPPEAPPTDPDAPTIRTAPPWDCELRHFPEGAKVLTLRLDPAAGTATFCGGPPHPLEFFERALKSFDLYERWDWLQFILAQGPCEPTTPIFRHSLPGGYTLELWPGHRDLACPFLQLRVIEPTRLDGKVGRVLLDMRGSVWAADVRLWDDQPRLVLDFLTRDNQGRSEYTRLPLILDLPSRRVTCERLPGSTSIGVLHNLVRTTRDAKWFVDDLTGAFTRGKPVPLP